VTICIVNQHIQRLKAKRHQEVISKQEQENKPGSGNIWKNKITKPTEPKLSTKIKARKSTVYSSRGKSQNKRDLGKIWDDDQPCNNDFSGFAVSNHKISDSRYVNSSKFYLHDFDLYN